MARTKRTLKRGRHGGGTDGVDPVETETAAPSWMDSFSNSASSIMGSSKEEKPVVAQEAGRRKRRHLRGGYAGSVKHPGAVTYATAVGGHRGGSHGVGVAAFASPFTQGGRRRRRKTRKSQRRHHKR